jgi:hypothetical protein
MNNERYRHHNITKEFLEVDREVDEVINKAFELRMGDLWNVDSHSGGYSVWAGPIWVRPYILNYWPLKGYNQLMGHTPQAEVWVVEEDEDGEKYENFKHYYVDVPHLDAEPMIIEI